MHRLAVALVMASVVAAGCSGATESPSPATASPIVPTTATDPAADPGAAPAATDPPPSFDSLPVTLEVSSAELGLQADLTRDIAEGGDPFGDFAVCSGHAAQIGSYLVGVGSEAGSVRWASVATADRVLGPGTYDADVRLELGSGEIIDAVGSLRLDEGLAAGTFAAATVGGAELMGRFECTGGSPSITGAVGTVVGLVEVVALLERGAAERVVSVVSDDTDVVACPLGAGGTPRLVEVDGDSSTGSLVAFELDDLGPAGGALAVTAGEVRYASDDAVIVVADSGTAGAFSASTADGVSIDGAFSCTAP